MSPGLPSDRLRRLGLSSVAVRKCAQRGTLQAGRMVYDGRPPVPPVPVQTTQVDGAAPESGAMVELDVVARAALAPLARERKRHSHAEQAAAMWQERARNLEVANSRLQEPLALPAPAPSPPRLRWWPWRPATAILPYSFAASPAANRTPRSTSRRSMKESAWPKVNAGRSTSPASCKPERPNRDQWMLESIQIRGLRWPLAASATIGSGQPVPETTVSDMA